MGTVACNRQHNQVIQQHSGPGAGLGAAKPVPSRPPARTGGDLGLLILLKITLSLVLF